MTQDVDLLVRDTPRNRQKLRRLCELLGNVRSVPVSDLSSVVTLVGTSVPVDVIFDALPGSLTFERLRSRAETLRIGTQVVRVASLSDIIRPKESADRPKDRAQLPILRETLRVRKAAKR